MSHFIDLTGQKFNMLTVLERVENANNGESRWRCICDCGNETFVTASNLKSGNVKSCGCLNTGHLTHGESHTNLYKVWKGMHGRCNNPNYTQYEDYGGRGIIVCDDWNNSYESFRDWANSNGYEPGLTIDRIDVNDNYYPDNCRWATRKQQCNNKRNTLYFTINDETHSLSDWCDILNIPYKIIYERIAICHQSFEQAINTPLPAHYYE